MRAPRRMVTEGTNPRYAERLSAGSGRAKCYFTLCLKGCLGAQVLGLEILTVVCHYSLLRLHLCDNSAATAAFPPVAVQH